MSSEQELTDLKSFIDSKQKLFEKATQGVKQALETISLNNQWKINTYMSFSRRLTSLLSRKFDFDLTEFEDDDEEVTEKTI